MGDSGRDVGRGLPPRPIDGGGSARFQTPLTLVLTDRFGLALCNLGDINKDRYEDVAVGAPYEGRGVVYIYLGSKQGIITEPSQVS